MVDSFVQRTTWQRLRLVLIVLLSTGVAACEDSSTDTEPAPSDCVRNEPEFGSVFVEVTIDGDHQEVPIRIFEGNFEDDVVVITDTLSTDEAEFELPVERDYSVAAEYQDGGETVLAIDGGRLSISHTDYEDARCWDVDNLRLDAKLVVDSRGAR